MKCEQVFDTLTRAPFPTGQSSDAAVERHLEACHECRELAEALRPATDLFHESLSEDQRQDLPGYRGPQRGQSAGSMAQAVLTAEEFHAPRSVRLPAAMPQSARRPLSQQWSAAPTRRTFNAFLVSGLALATILLVGAQAYMGSGGFPSSDNHSSLLTRSGDALNGRLLTLTVAKAREHLRAANLASACREPRKEMEHLVAYAGGDAPLSSWRCCTECHAAGKANRPAVDAIAVANLATCQACHTP